MAGFDQEPAVTGYTEALDLVEMDVREQDPTTETPVPSGRQTRAAQFAGYLGLTSGYDQEESLGAVEDGAWLGDDRLVSDGYHDDEERR